MGNPIYREYDSDSLYAQYNNRAMIAPEALEVIREDQGRRTEAFLASSVRSELDIAYGDHPRERLDLFLPDARRPPLFAYIHGGYWQLNTKDLFAYLGEQLVPAGAAFANIDYALCPDVTLSALTDQVRRAMAYLWRNAERHGYDQDRIVVSGHSAGGHLTAMMMATDWPAFDADLPGDILAGALPISGIYDIEPIRMTPLNDAVRISDSEARALSPLFLSPTSSAPMVVVVGGTESDEFHRQAEDLTTAWRKSGLSAEVLMVPGCEHFAVLHTLAEPGHDLPETAKKLLGL